jgi:hypothetical protein
MLALLGLTDGLSNDFDLLETSVPGVNIAESAIQPLKLSRNTQMDLSEKNVANRMTLSRNGYCQKFHEKQ